MSLRNSILIIAIVLLVDQFVKIYIKTNFVYGEAGQIDVASWFKILLIENEGMAWGAKIPGEYGKLILTVFRILAVFGIGYWLYDASTKHSSAYLMVAIALVYQPRSAQAEVVRPPRLSGCYAQDPGPDWPSAGHPWRPSSRCPAHRGGSSQA